MRKFVTIIGFIRIFAVLLSIVIVMFGTNYLLMKSSTQRLYEQMKENNRLVVSSIIQSIDNSFKDINSLIYSIDILPYDSRTLNNEGNYSNYLLYKDMNKLITLSSSHDYLEEAVVFFENSNIAVTSVGTIDLNELLNKQYQSKQKNSMFWTSFFGEERPFQVFPAADYKIKVSGDNFHTKKLITIAGNTQFSSKNIIIFLDVEALLETVNQKTMMDETSFIILDHDNNVILSTEDKLNLGDVVQGLYLNEGEETILTNRAYEYVVYKSDYNGFTYINQIPIQYTALDSITEGHRTITITSLVVSFFLLFLLGLYLFRPIQKLSSLIGGEPNWSSIHKGISRLTKELKASQDQEGTLKSELRLNRFLNALHLTDNGWETTYPFTNFISNRQFILMKLAFDHKPPIEKCKGFIIKDFGRKEMIWHATNTEFLVLVGVDRSFEREQLLESVHHLIDHVGKKWQSNMKAFISKVYDSRMEHLHSAYQDILDASIYGNIGAEDPIYDAETIPYNPHMYFPADQLEKLSNLIFSGNEQDSIVIINDIIDKNKDANIQRHQFIAILQSTLLFAKRHLTLQADDEQVLHTLEKDFLKSTMDSLDEMTKSFMQIIKFISQKTRQTQASKLDRTFIAQYIELHYMDNLYLEHMASITDTSSKYFSKFFKKTFGVNFIEYLHQTRIHHAKEYLKTENSTIAEIGEKVGYLNATTFASTFKKYTGVSPKQYRDKIIKGE
ncbi:helix-turn-helix transcriptional regulator [Bacillus niameyensis]|uniref:helix-turn-helix transcriptional regulator n=1 Tax=Bacillus niameyensis TaxID=1522308 RepID=UPI00078023E6|nr:AraC family transcriptional regulator [Bacillus niameyensis]